MPAGAIRACKGYSDDSSLGLESPLRLPANVPNRDVGHNR